MQGESTADLMADLSLGENDKGFSEKYTKERQEILEVSPFFLSSANNIVYEIISSFNTDSSNLDF